MVGADIRERIASTGRGFLRADGGQTVVLVALMFTVLLGFVGAAIDAGRFYAERRFLQSAVDAAALGCAQKLISGGSIADAEAQGKTILRTYNLPGGPSGTAIVVSETPQYNNWFNMIAGDRRNLYDGVIASSTNCRAAVEGSMKTYFLTLLGLRSLSTPAQAHATVKGGMLPVVVNRYRDPPGPSSTFIDYTKQETYQTVNPGVCSENGGGSCPDAAPSAIGCTTGCLWGPETVIAGQGYVASDADFRGFIALDIRDFSTVDGSGNAVHEYYNNAGGMNANQLKDQEASYVNGGYPGPDLVAYDPSANPVQKGLQIATMSGNSAGVVVANFNQWMRVGDKILIQLFDGQVREIPDFTINAPSVITATSPMGPGATGPTFRVGANQRFREANDWVDLELLDDTFNGGANSDTPTAFHTNVATFSPDNFTPAGGSGTQVTLRDLHIDGSLASGIYSVVIKGTGYQPPNPGGATLSTKKAYVPVNVGDVKRDFAMAFTATTVEVAATEEAVFTFQLTTGSGTTAWNGGNVTYAIDRGTCAVGSIALTSVGGSVVCGTATFDPSGGATPQKVSPPTVTLRVPTTALGTGTFTLVVRARGTGSEGPVVHVQELTLAVGTAAGGATKYVNVQGYAVFMITSMTSNTVLGRAISGYYANPEDEALKIARRSGLVPWEKAPY